MLGLVALIGMQPGLASAQASWSFRAAMPSPRAGVSAALLDGKIYVIGGVDADGQVVEELLVKEVL